MEGLLIAFVWLLNFGISWWNSYAVGSAWTEARAAGGWPRFMAWMGAIMAASGFTWCYLLVIAGGAYALHLIPLMGFKFAMAIGYIMIIPGLLFSGLMITVVSWARAYREGGVLNYGVAAYNTYAQYHNTASAIQGMGQAFGDVFDGVKGIGDSDEPKGALVLIGLILAVIAAAAGIITTVCLIKKYSASAPLLSYEELQARKLAREQGR